MDNFSDDEFDEVPVNKLTRLSISPAWSSSSTLYRGSSMAAVFGGNKPLLSPSRLSNVGNFGTSSPVTATALYAHHVCCQSSCGSGTGFNNPTIYGQYGVGVIYGRNIPSPSLYPCCGGYHQFPNKRDSKCSSVSSGIFSRDSESRTPTPTPKEFFSNSSATLNFYEMPIPHLSYKSHGLNPVISRSNRIVGSAGKMFHQVVQPKFNGVTTVPDPLYSDDEEMPSVENKPKKKIRNLAQQRNRHSTKKSETQDSLNPIRLTDYFYYLTNFFPVIIKAFLRFFLFLNIIMLACIFFVGEWPQPINSIINRFSNLYLDTFEYIYPFVWKLEDTVNILLSLLYPDENEQLEHEVSFDSLFHDL